MTTSTVCLTLTGVFTALLAVLCMGPQLMPVTMELMALLTLLAAAHVLTGRGNALDRTARVALVVVGGMLAVSQWLLWQRGEDAPMGLGVLRTVGRFGLVGVLASWTALISAQRSAGQYVYNLVFVSSFALLIGHVSTRLVLETPPGAPGGLAVWLEGAALGSAFSYVTMGLREPNKNEDPGGTAS